ncbi:hypothetical protein [Paenibacillus sp. Marseille-Q4541]|uniref:hypothetical protein n=1 Tax=Paenibacillus sp. Marseille-Q4541 TaxID=2831522 RepID=UPI001BABA4BB|nr:hypothetical protein [Paenibacillus sp. Marseille-Q4541]
MSFPNNHLNGSDEDVAKRKAKEKHDEIANHSSIGSGLLTTLIAGVIILAIIIGIFYLRMS